MVEANEADLAKRLTQRDPEAFEEFYEGYRNIIFGFIYSRGSERFDAEDMTQDTIFKVWKGVPGYIENGGHFRGWVWRIATNTLHDFNRKPRPTIPLDEMGDEPSYVVPEIDSHPEVQKALERLTTDQREVIELIFFKDLTLQEVAIHTGRKYNAVRQLQSRAFRAMRKCLEKK